MGDFLSAENACGRALLQLVSRGNAIIAEILRVEKEIPNLFKLESKYEQQLYNCVIKDFSYFEAPETIEKNIEKNPQAVDLDWKVRAENSDILRKIFLTFESVYKYATDVNQLIEEIEDGFYIQQSMEVLFSNGEGKQLLCECLYLYGIMLFVIDIHIEGVIRERLLVSYYRYCAQTYITADVNIDDVCKLMRCTELEQGKSKRPSDYPVQYFNRVPIKEDFVKMVIGYLRTDDVYNQISAYPTPEHRSTALSSQAAMLFVCLFFDPAVLHSQPTKMREIVDKFFPDTWVISMYMGLTVNLLDIWQSFKAARLAIANTLEGENFLPLIDGNASKLKKCVKHIKQFLRDGAITEEKITDGAMSAKFLGVCRDSNVVLRWFIMHTAPQHSIVQLNKKCKQIRDDLVIRCGYSEMELLELLLCMAEFELKLKESYKKSLHERDKKWIVWRDECVSRTEELADVFSGDKPLTRIKKNDHLQTWFRNIGKQLQAMNIEKPKSCTLRIIRIMQALEQVQELQELRSHHHVMEYFKELRSIMEKMVMCANVKEEVLVDLHIIADISYAWKLVDNFTNLMQHRIKRDPSSVSQLRAAFLKLCSAIETPLLRINQANCEQDFACVSRYYSQELVFYIEKVLHIIPESMFQSVASIVRLQGKFTVEMPTKLDKSKIKEHVKWQDERIEEARLTRAISVLSEGILRMETTLVGIVTIDPKRLLEEGIRKELRKHLTLALNTYTSFSLNSKTKMSNLSENLDSLCQIMYRFARSLEYIQDYGGPRMRGLKMFQDELRHITYAASSEECKSLVASASFAYRKGLTATLTTDQYRINPPNFIGRLVNEIIKVTNPKTTIYVPDTMVWYDQKCGSEVLSSKIFTKISKSFGLPGLISIDNVLSHFIAAKLQTFFNVFRNEVMKDKMCVQYLQMAEECLSPNSEIIENPSKVYGYLSRKMKKVSQFMLDTLLQVGQMQIMRKQISLDLEISCKFHSKRLFSNMRALNECIVNEIKGRNSKVRNAAPSSSNGKSECVVKNSPLMRELCEYFERVGLHDPYSKIYEPNVDNETSRLMTTFSFILVISQLSTSRDKMSGATSQSAKKFTALQFNDAAPFVIAFKTLLHQFDCDFRSHFLLNMDQYLASYLALVTENDGVNAANILDEAKLSSSFIKTLFHYYFGEKNDLLNDEAAVDITQQHPAFHLYESVCILK